MSGCEWDDATGELSGFMQFGYDGEDFLVFDLKTLTWIAPKQQAVATKMRWDTSAEIKYTVHYLTQMCLEWLKLFLTYAKSSLQRTDPPSVSLLQKTPSSPVSCHATGFYPDRAVMFWRKDGEEIHEDVDHGEILPNHDGSFQMSVDLNVLSVTSEDWRRYDCVFQISGVKDNIITKLDKAVIRTNWEEPSVMTVPIVAAVVVLALVLIAAAGLMAYRKKKTKCTTIGVIVGINRTKTDTKRDSPDIKLHLKTGGGSTVFQLSGMKDDIITKLDKAKIRTNWGKNEIRLEKVTKLSNIPIPITAAVVVLAVVLIAAILHLKTGGGSTVFQLSGMKDDIITKLDKAKIRTNWGKNEIRLEKVTKLSNIPIPITAAVVVLAVVLIAAIVFFVYKKKKVMLESGVLFHVFVN
ncbi:major histocompatibility complex class I-related gene protein-like [Micropterus dolomieu]|uniref:major histocompatibility complex class I-related gene protein-like n=1 Tax=Micropterus dolomieu TaxID=147949 RepID=UPI001E8CFE29|nr:major histocompatibility complex class I-related gene protein-like [Micropterus dolomieu]